MPYRVFPVLIFLSFSFFQVHAQEALDGFMKGFRNLDVVLSYSNEQSKNYLTRSNGIDTTINLSISTQSISFFGAFGISDKLDVILTAPYVQRTNSAKGLQDAGLYLKYRSINTTLAQATNFGLMTGIGITAPMSNYDPEHGRAIGQQAVTVPLRVIAQLDFPSGLFFNAVGGYTLRLDKIPEALITDIRNRTDNTGNLIYPDFEAPELADYITFSAKLGFAASKHYADIWFLIQQTDGGTNYRETSPAIFQSLGVSYQQIGGTYYFSILPELGFFASAAKVLNGRNIGDGFRWSVGGVYKFIYDKQ